MHKSCVLSSSFKSNLQVVATVDQQKIDIPAYRYVFSLIIPHFITVTTIVEPVIIEIIAYLAETRPGQKIAKSFYRE